MATNNNFKVKNGLEIPSTDSISVSDTAAPSIRPSLNLDFANSKKLDPRITFTRASTGTYYDGKTTAVAEQNLLSYSNTFDGASYWSLVSGVTITANSTTAPDGSSTAYSLTETSATSVHELATGLSCNFIAGLPYTFSIYAKANGTKFIHLIAYGGFVANSYATFDLSNGVVANTSNVSPTIAYVGNGWYRCSITTVATTTWSERFYIFLSNGANTLTPSYQGSTSNSIYVWGAQLEQRSNATVYTPTTSSIITNYIPVLQTATTNTARFDHDSVTGESKGLLIEESRTNIIPSIDQTNWYNQSNSATSYMMIRNNAMTAPDGTTRAAQIIESSTSTATQHFVGCAATLTAGVSYTYSIYAKECTNPNKRYFCVGSSGTAFTSGGTPYGASIAYDLSTGTKVYQSSTDLSTNTITYIGNGWYRITYTGVANASTAYNFYAYSSNVTTNVGAALWNGDGISGFYTWGAQLEAGAFATSYIPTPLAYNGRLFSATYKAADGLIRTAAPNVARYEPNVSGGSNLLLEGASTNYNTYSAQPLLWDASYGSGASQALAPASVPAPDGSMTAAAFVSKISTSGDHVLQGPLTSLSTGTVTASIYVKSFGVNSLRFAVASSDIASRFRASYYLSTSTIDTTGNDGTGFTYISSSITDVGGGWYRLTLTGTISSACKFYIVTQQTTNVFSWVQPQGTGLYVWGGQIESGSIATSFIPSVETHTGRSSTGTYYDANGVIRTALSGQPRYTYNPSLLTAPPKLLLEATATNLLTYSEQLDLRNKYVSAVTANATQAPDGLTTADKIVAAIGNASHSNYLNFTATSGTVYTLSAYAKAAEYSGVTCRFNYTGLAGGANYLAKFNVSNGTIISVDSPAIAGIQYVGNGWYRIWITAVAPASGSAVIEHEVLGPSLEYSYAGDGSSGVYVWGSQLETSYAPTSYIPTSASAVTRAADTSTSAAQSRSADLYSSSQVTRSADTVSITGSRFSSWYKQDEGTFYIETSKIASKGNTYPQLLGGDTGSDSLIGLYRSTNDAVYINMSGGAGPLAYVATGVFDSGVKAITSYDRTSERVAANGSVVYERSSVTPRNQSQLLIGQRAGTDFANATIKKVTYYPKRLTNAELISLTSV